MFKSFTIKNFKSIEDLTLELGPLTVLVGKSGTGKSNIIDAIWLLRDLVRGRKGNDGSIEPRGGWKQLKCALPDIKFATIQTCFTVPGFEEDFEYALQLNFNQSTIELTNERLDRGSSPLFPSNTLKTRKIQIPHNDQGDISTIIDHTADSLVSVNALSYLANDIGVYGSWEPKNRSAHSDYRRPGQLTDGPRGIIPTVKELSVSTSAENQNTWKSIIASVKHLNPSVSEIRLDHYTNPKDVLVSHKFGDAEITLALKQESTGFQKFLSSLVSLYQVPRRSLIIFEEPENGIHPAALAALADHFNDVTKRGLCQVLLTTHSPQLLDHFDPDCIRVVELKAGKTTVGKMAKDQSESIKEGLMYAGELLTVTQPRTGEPEMINQ